MANAKPFFNGVPTDPDVRKLMEHYGIPTPGTIIRHDEIETVIGSPWRSNRYRGVVEAWRRRLYRTLNVDTGAETGIGIKVLNNSDRIEASKGHLKRGTIQYRLGAQRVSTVNRLELSPIEKIQADRVQEVSTRMYMAAASELKALRPPRPPTALPRIK